MGNEKERSPSLDKGLFVLKVVEDRQTPGDRDGSSTKSNHKDHRNHESLFMYFKISMQPHHSIY